MSDHPIGAATAAKDIAHYDRCIAFFEKLAEEGGYEDAELGIGAGGDITTIMDRLAEEVVLVSLDNAGHDLLVVSEEAGERRIGRGSESVLFCDPLDGSVNAQSG